MEGSFPDPGTTIGDETTAAKACVAELTAMNLTKIVLLTHIGYFSDLAEMANIEGVDVIIGGHSHTLLGNASVLGRVGLVPLGDYATIVNNTCIVQAWCYNQLVGKLNVTFDDLGVVQACNGEISLPIDSTKFTVLDGATEFDLPAADATIFKDYLFSLGIFADPGQDQNVTTALQPYRDSLQKFTLQTIAAASEKICNSYLGVVDPTCPGTPAQSAVGGGACLIVAESFLHDIPDADIAIQNAGGCRTYIAKGNFSFGDAYTILPFGDTLVTLKVTGAQIKSVLEDAANNSVTDAVGSDFGSFPVAAGLRWACNYTADFGNRFSNIQVNSRFNSTWVPLDLAANYTIVTNDYVATPKDGYWTFGEINKNDHSVYRNTYVVDAQTLIDYSKSLGTLSNPPIDKFSTQKLVFLDGTVYDVTATGSNPSPSPASPTAPNAPTSSGAAPSSSGNTAPSSSGNTAPASMPSTTSGAGPTPASAPHAGACTISTLFGFFVALLVCPFII